MKSVYKVLGAVLGCCVLALSLPATGGKFVKYPLPETIRVSFLNNDRAALKGKIVLDFGAAWCGPCKELSVALENENEGINNKSLISYIQEHGGQFYQWDVSKDWDDTNGTSATNLCKKFEVATVPVLLFLEDGKVVARKKGFNKDETKELIQQVKNFIDKKK